MRWFAGVLVALTAAGLAGCAEKTAGTAAPGESTTDRAPATSAGAPKKTTPRPSAAPAVAPPTRVAPLPESVTCTFRPDQSGAAARPVKAPEATPVSARGTVSATVDTSAGEIDLTLDRALAPCTVHSFVSLVGQKYYDDTECHRLTTNPSLQVLQCGDPTGTGRGGPGYSFDDEVFPELKYGRGILAMANAGKDPSTGEGTNGSQFFIVYGAAELPPNYTAFGTIGPKGLETVDAVAEKGVSTGGEDGRPDKAVKIKTLTTG